MNLAILIEVVGMGCILLFVVTQIGWPLLTNAKLFPLFRPEWRKLRRDRVQLTEQQRQHQEFLDNQELREDMREKIMAGLEEKQK